MLKDVQGQVDQRHIALKQVGVRDIRWPITLKDPHKGVQHSVAVISLGVNLPHEQRGTHMSRFVECLKEMGPIHPHDLEIVLDGLKEKLGAKKAMLDMRFPYFIEKKAPVSGKTGYLDISCHYHAEKGETFHLDVGVNVPIHTLCPCSKAISGPVPRLRSVARNLYGSKNWWKWPRLLLRLLSFRCLSVLMKSLSPRKPMKILVLLRTRPGKSPCGSIKMSGLIGTA